MRMIKMRRRSAWFCLLLGGLVPGAAGEVPTNERVMAVVKRTVGASGQPIITLGSWVSGRRYGDPLKGGTSDHDMRLLLPRGTKPEVALKEWKDMRKALVSGIRAEFGAEADKVLATMNLYPPTQLMQEVENPADALDAFRRMRVSPKLDYDGPGADIPPKAAEGLYGPGATTWTQRYEQAAGRLIYREGDTVYAGMTDLTHLSEGTGRYTTGGMANTARQWAEHAEEELRSGKGDKVAKYLERLERDLMKARDLQRFDIHGPARQELHALMQELREHPEHLVSLETRVQSVLKRSKLESAILARVDRAGLTQKAVLRVMLDAIDARSTIGEALRTAADKVPPEKLLSGLQAFLAARELAGVAGENDPGKLLVATASYLLPLGPALLTQLAQATLDAAKESGYALMASSQEPFDLLAGIYTAGGRPDPNGTHYTLDQLVAACHDEAKLRSFIFALARRAADRNAGDATAAADAKVADAIMARCFPVLLRAWRAQREALAAEYLDLADVLRTAAPRLRYAPNPAVGDAASGRATITITARSSDPQFETHRKRLVEILTLLHGPGCFVSVTDRWQEGGKEGTAANEQVYSYDRDDVYTVQLEERVVAGGAPVPRDSPLAFDTTLTASVEIPVRGVRATGPTDASRELLSTLRQTVYCRFSLNGRAPIEWLDGRQPAQEVGNIAADFSWGGPEHPLVWQGNSFSMSFKDVNVEKIRGGPMRDRGYDKTATYEISLTGTVDPATARILKVRGVTTYTLDHIPINVPPKGPPVVQRQILEFRDLGPMVRGNNGFVEARLNKVPPDRLKAHLVECTNTGNEATFRNLFGTGDPKICTVDFSVTFGK